MLSCALEMRKKRLCFIVNEFMKIFNFENCSVSERDIILSQDVFGRVVNNDILALVVRWQMAKRRSGGVATRSIEQIDATTKKPYRQKGTGRARQGSLVGPHYRGGAKAHGPNLREYVFSVNKKIRSLALKMTLSHKVRNDNVFIVERLDSCEMKTSSFVKKMDYFYESMAFEKKKSCIFVCEPDESASIIKATTNLVGFNFLPICGINVLDLLKHDCVFFSNKSFDLLCMRFK